MYHEFLETNFCIVKIIIGRIPLLILYNYNFYYNYIYYNKIMMYICTAMLSGFDFIQKGEDEEEEVGEEEYQEYLEVGDKLTSTGNDT